MATDFDKHAFNRLPKGNVTPLQAAIEVSKLSRYPALTGVRIRCFIDNQGAVVDPLGSNLALEPGTELRGTITCEVDPLPGLLGPTRTFEVASWQAISEDIDAKVDLAIDWQSYGSRLGEPCPEEAKPYLEFRWLSETVMKGVWCAPNADAVAAFYGVRERLGSNGDLSQQSIALPLVDAVERPDYVESTTDELVYVEDGNGFRISGFGEEGHFMGFNGYGYLHKILSKHPRKITAAELKGGTEKESKQEISDSAAIADYEKEEIRLDDAIEIASAVGEDTRELERQRLLLRANDPRKPNGLSSDFVSEVKKAEKALRSSMSRVIGDLIDKKKTKLARHFKNHIKIAGGVCHYDSEKKWRTR